MTSRYLVFLLIIFSDFLFLSGQEQDSSLQSDVSGYISLMPSLYHPKNPLTPGSDSILWQTMIHNRINFHWYLTDYFNGAIELRNQIIGGDIVYLSTIENGFQKESYMLPLTFKHKMGERYLFSTSFDRLWLQFSTNNLEITIGRQRINWGQTFVWNPNDLFNTYNFFDFDYPERPGADAIRFQYYTGSLSSFDLVSKIDSSGKLSGAGLFKFNIWNTDIQFLGGLTNQSKYVNGNLEEVKYLVSGTGFSGSVKNISLRGEMSYFNTLNSNSEPNLFLISLAADYSFSNQIYLIAEFFYSSSNESASGSNIYNFNQSTQSVKSLAYTKYNFFGQLSYPISPILNISAGSMFFTDEKMTGFYAGPTIDLSLSNNLSLSGIFQYIAFKFENPSIGDEWITSSYLFARLKWNF